MEKELLIIDLILQDLKHNQLLTGLEKIGLNGSDTHYLGILEIVFQLMKVPEQIANDWGELYVKFMNQAIHYEITSSTKKETLKPLAEVCYRQLKVLIKDQN